MIFFRAAAYLRYLILSSHRKGHGIHSPFVFDLVSRIFRNKLDHDIVLYIEKVRKKMISDQRIIEINDLGSGSVRNRKDKTRRVSEIARYSSVSKKHCILLSNMAREFGEPCIIELGTSLGISSMYMALNCPDTILHTIEGCSERAKIAAENFEQARIKNIILYNRSFDEVLPEILDLCPKPGLVFIDGNHRRESLLRYFSMIAERSDNRTVVMVDDIYLSPEMELAWNEIKVHSKVSVTIDVHSMGIVFFRKGINSNHFVVRY
jgi:predicted O-methyltransferase YrrM